MAWGIDLDNVLGDTLGSFADFHNAVYGTSFKREDFREKTLAQAIGCTLEESRKRMKAFEDSSHANNIQPMPGSQKGVLQLAKKSELVVVTARPISIEERTVQWVKRHFPDCFSSVYLADRENPDRITVKKADTCRSLGVELLVEDWLDTAVECAAKGIKVLLYDSLWNQDGRLPEGITRVRGWEEIVRYAERIKV